jgi:hypothetical protein
MKAGTPLAAAAVDAIASSWKDGKAWCVVCEAMNEFGVRAHKHVALRTALRTKKPGDILGRESRQAAEIPESSLRLKRASLLYEVMDKTASVVSSTLMNCVIANLICLYFSPEFSTLWIQGSLALTAIMSR